MKILRLPQSDPKNFGPKRVRSKRYRELEEHGQLNLFTSGKILHLQSLSTFEEALLLDERGDSEGAKKLYQKAIERKESVDDAYCNLGIIAFGEEKFAEAVDYLTMCLSKNPRHYQAHFNLANVYAEIGNMSLARQHYRICIRINPDFVSAYFNLGLTLASFEEYDAAVKALRTYLDLADFDDQQPALELIQQMQALADIQD